ncbi:UNVERIFIED_CONTAM: Ribonuclease HI [Sesamum latifolium]|uniref:Ribonuclease HI n=1 Tax=Sesamum latifolium TaxID=2727402 RepID=A0AAW2XQL5_9LAMI
MQLGNVPLEAVDTSLYGFAGEVVHPRGMISLPLTLGTSPLQRTCLLKFLVVDIPSAYNVILGRPTFNAFRAIISTYHMKIKFPVIGGVGEAQADMLQARKCYVEAIKRGRKEYWRKHRAKKTPQVLGKPKTSGRLIKWAIELSEYNISYLPRMAIKAQALADFVSEMTGTTQEEVLEARPWLLHVDGSSTAQGSGVGIVLTTPQGDDMEFTVKFEFKTSNNEAEYEALVLDMKMAQDTGASHLLAYSDSQLIVKQVSGEYEAKEESMVQYLQQIEGLKTKFKSFQLHQIPREENIKEDFVSKLASALEDCKTRVSLCSICPNHESHLISSPFHQTTMIGGHS